MNKTTNNNLGRITGDTVKTSDKAGKYRLATSLLALLCVSAAAIPANAQTPADGVMMLQNLTVPAGGVWLASASATGGGHWWQTDQVLGICRVDSATGQNPPWQLTNCAGAVKAGGQAVLANIGPKYTTSVPANAKFVFVPDASTKSTQVVRFVYNPAGEGTLTSPLIMNVPNVAGAHGGAQGGRSSAAVLAPNGIDLYVGYTKSGDIMKVADATNTTSVNPVVTQIGETSDTIGVRSMALHKGDLYLAEMGGFGLSRIQDPAGLTRAACTPAAVCTGITLSPNISSFPGGLASDGTYLYVGDSPLTTPGSILKYDPAKLIVTTYSATVPAYTATFDGVVRNAYRNPFGLAFGPNGDLYVADDPSAALVLPVLPTLQGHLWRVPAAPAPPAITNLSLVQGAQAGGDVVTITGSGFALDTTTIIGASSTVTANTIFMFGNVQATIVRCGNTVTTTCYVTTPSSAGPGTVDVQAIVAGTASPLIPADQFTYVGNVQSGSPVVNSINPKSGVFGGGTIVTITGSNLAGGFVTFGVNPATFPACIAGAAGAPDVCTAVSPAGSTGSAVDVQVTNVAALTSAPWPGDKFTYSSPTASIYAWGITAPKGGMVWVPGSLGGHWWSSDHSAGFCRQDAVTAPGSTLHALNSSICDDGSIGSSGQAVYDPSINPVGTVNTTSGVSTTIPTHYIYVPDNAVKSVAIWRLTFDPLTETLVGPPEGMIPLADVRTLKPNGMAMDPDGNLYVSDLTEMNIRKITGPNGDPRLQTVTIVAVTGDGRGANGTMGFLGYKLYVSENRAAAWFDVRNCPNFGTPCTTTPILLPSGAFVAGVATDQKNGFVYASDSPGGANATIWRHNPTTGVTSLYLQGGIAPAAGSPNATVWNTQTCLRPWDPTWTPGGLGGFSFVFGINVDPVSGDLFVTEDHTAGNRGGRGTAWRAPYIP